MSQSEHSEPNWHSLPTKATARRSVLRQPSHPCFECFSTQTSVKQIRLGHLVSPRKPFRDPHLAATPGAAARPPSRSIGMGLCSFPGPRTMPSLHLRLLLLLQNLRFCAWRLNQNKHQAAHAENSRQNCFHTLRMALLLANTLAGRRGMLGLCNSKRPCHREPFNLATTQSQAEV